MLDSVPMVAITGNVPVRPDRQGRVPGDRHQRHHAADDQAQLPGPRRRRAAAGRRRGVPHRAQPADPARSTSTSPRTPSSRRPGPSTRPTTRWSPGCRGSGPTSTATAASSRRRPRRSPNAKRPVILAGHGVLHAEAWDDLRAFAEKTSIPVAWTLLGIGAMDETHPLAYGYMGMHGWKHVNRAIQSADLLIAIGMRFDDRVTGNVRTYAPYARIIHVDIDPAEIGKNVAVEVPIVGDAGRVLRALTPMVPETTADERARVPRPAGRLEARLRGVVVARLRGVARRAAVGRLRRRAHRRADRPRGAPTSPTSARTRCGWPATPASANPNSHVSSGGLGTMGFSVPAAMGAALGRPGPRDVGDHRRRRLPDDVPGADDPRRRRHPGEDRPARQQEARDDPAVAGDHLRRELPLGEPARAGLREARRRVRDPGVPGVARRARSTTPSAPRRRSMARRSSGSRSPRSRTSSR